MIVSFYFLNNFEFNNEVFELKRKIFLWKLGEDYIFMGIR